MKPCLQMTEITRFYFWDVFGLCNGTYIKSYHKIQIVWPRELPRPKATYPVVHGSPYSSIHSESFAGILNAFFRRNHDIRKTAECIMLLQFLGQLLSELQWRIIWNKGILLEMSAVPIATRHRDRRTHLVGTYQWKANQKYSIPRFHR